MHAKCSLAWNYISVEEREKGKQTFKWKNKKASSEFDEVKEYLNWE